MSFLAPLWLALAAGVAVPLVVHLLRRRSGARVEFPALRYLLRAEQESSRRSRLHNLLLMALRILVVLLVALAAARPVGRLGGGGHPPTAVAIVLDNSLSSAAVVGGRRVFDDLRDAARAVAAEATAADRLWLVTADSVVAGGSRAAVLAALEAAEPLRGAGTPAGALARAAALVRAAGLPDAHVAVVTDAQASAWRAAPPPLTGLALSLYAPRGAPPANAAVVGALARPQRWTPGGELAMRFVGAAPGAAYRVALGETTLVRGSVPPAGERGYSEASARAAPSARGWQAGVVSLPPDELRQDDARHFAVAVGAPPRLAADPSAGPFAAAAVDALVESARATAGPDVRLVGADALVRLPALVAAPVDPVRLGAANRALARAGVPWRFGAPRTGEQTATGVGDTSVARRVVVRRRYALVAQPGAAADTLARVAGEAWIVAGPNYVLVASPLVPEAGTLPLQAAFVPLVASLVGERLGGSGARVVDAAPGMPYTVPGGVDALVVGGGRTAISAGTRRAAPRAPGVYWFERAGATAGALVVNVETEESVLQRIPVEELGRRLGARRTATATDGPSLARLAFGGGTAGRPLGAAFLVAALVALAAETLVARGRGRAG